MIVTYRRNDKGNIGQHESILWWILWEYFDMGQYESYRVRILEFHGLGLLAFGFGDFFLSSSLI